MGYSRNWVPDPSGGNNSGFTSRSETRGTSREAPFTFFGRSNPGFKTEAQIKSRNRKLCGKQHGIWTC